MTFHGMPELRPLPTGQFMELIGPDIRRKFDDALGSGDMFALFERTRKAIEQYPDDPDVRFLQALAMARLGDPHAALRIYERNRVEEIGTEDAISLKGRLLKDLAVRAEGEDQIRLFRESSEAYNRANQLSDGYFSGINAATTSFLAGERDRRSKACDGDWRAARRRRAPEFLRRRLGRGSHAGSRRG